MAKILIIEDDSLLVKVYTTRLTRDGHQVLFADNGETGLLIAKKEKPQVIVLDIMIPKISGLDVLAQLKKDETLKEIPVLIFSNLNSPKQIAKARELGAADFMTKAFFNPYQVVQKIESYLK